MAILPQITVTEAGWTQLTTVDATSIKFQNQGPGDIWVRYTTDGTAPGALLNGDRYSPGQGEALRPITELSSLVGADRVWCRACTPTHAIVTGEDNT